MRLTKLAGAVGALGLVATPIVAQAANAPAAREAAAVDAAEDLAGGSGIFVALLALAAIVGGVIIALEDGNEPVSP